MWTPELVVTIVSEVVSALLFGAVVIWIQAQNVRSNKQVAAASLMEAKAEVRGTDSDVQRNINVTLREKVADITLELAKSRGTAIDMREETATGMKKLRETIAEQATVAEGKDKALKSAEEQLKEMRAAITRLDAGAKESAREIASLRDAVRERDVRIETLEADLKKEVAKRQTLEDSLTAATAENAGLRQRIKALENAQTSPKAAKE